MLDFRLRVFYNVAKLLNFTKAAAQLHISQPAVTKHIKELEQEFKITLFDRQPNALTLTEAGTLFYKHAITIMEHYELLDFDMNSLQNKLTGDLRIGASTTIAQYILPPVLAAYHQRFPEVKINLSSENSNQILHRLLEKDIDMALVEGKANNSNVHFSPFAQDQLVLACNKNTISKKNTVSLKELTTLPFIMREDDSGTYEILEDSLKNAGVNISRLRVSMHLGSTEAIKLFLEHSDHFAFISVHALRNDANNLLKVIDIDGLEINRTLHVATRQGQPVPNVSVFIHFLNNNKQ